jgi:hypothetical protein
VKYEHGTHAAYALDKCRCEGCRFAHGMYERDRARRIEPAYVGAEPARAHIAELRAVGVGLKQVSKVSGVSHGALWKLVYGVPGRGPSKRVRKSTLDRVLAVTARDAAAGSKVSATSTWARVDEMVAAGVPRVRIAEAIGQRGPGLQLGREFVSARNARAVTDLHRRWRAGDLALARRDSHGGSRTVLPPPAERGLADVSDLIVRLAEIVELRNDQPWRAEAACRGRPAYLWFPARGDDRTREAGLKICRACPVRADCRAAMLDERVGTYGALPADVRRTLRHEEAMAG